MKRFRKMSGEHTHHESFEISVLSTGFSVSMVFFPFMEFKKVYIVYFSHTYNIVEAYCKAGAASTGTNCQAVL